MEALMAQEGASGPAPAPHAAARGGGQRGLPASAERAIIHLDMDCFFASVAAADNPAFVGAHSRRTTCDPRVLFCSVQTSARQTYDVVASLLSYTRGGGRQPGRRRCALRPLQLLPSVCRCALQAHHFMF